MGFADLFKSTKELEREKRKAQRSNERQVERGLVRMDGRIKKLEKQRALLWAKAREMVQAGQKSEAAKMVNQYKILGVQINNLEKQRLLIQGKLNNVATAGDLGNIVKALESFAVGVDIDPDEIQSGLDSVADVEGEIGDVNSVVNEFFEEDVAHAGEAAEAQGSEVTDEDLMSALESEAAAEVSGGKVSELSVESKENINSGRDRLRALLDGK